MMDGPVCFTIPTLMTTMLACPPLFSLSSFLAVL